AKLEAGYLVQGFTAGDGYRARGPETRRVPDPARRDHRRGAFRCRPEAAAGREAAAVDPVRRPQALRHRPGGTQGPQGSGAGLAAGVPGQPGTRRPRTAGAADLALAGGCPGPEARAYNGRVGEARSDPDPTGARSDPRVSGQEQAIFMPAGNQAGRSSATRLQEIEAMTKNYKLTGPDGKATDMALKEGSVGPG